jgi:tetratricopeptide (TPR) repeat protein
MPGRNHPCPCGSGKKYKACCGRLAVASGLDVSGAEAAAGGGALAGLAALMSAGRYAQLEEEARSVVRAHSKCGEAWLLLGIASSSQGRDALHPLAIAAGLLPNDPVAQLNYGNALGRSGLLDEAAARYERALNLEPEFAEALGNLGNVLLERGRPEEAVKMCLRATEIKPGFAEAHNTLGTALLKLARTDEAITSFRRALLQNDGFAEAHASLANALGRVGRLDEAVASYRRALEIKPDCVAWTLGLATAQRLRRRAAEAEAACRQALAIDSRSAAALTVLAELRADAGQFAQAEDYFNRAAVIDPQLSEAWAGVPRVRRMTRRDESWLAGAQRLLKCALTQERKLTLCYAIGKYFDDIKDFENAFHHYRLANELAKSCGPAHDRIELTRRIDLLIRTHDREWFKRMRREAGASERPVFIVGTLRSGTTLAEQILASHPAVFGAGELNFWVQELAAAMTPAPERGTPPVRIDDSRLARLGADYLALVRRLSADQLPDGAEQATRWADKMPTNFLALGLIHAALPGARVIHMTRDPRDTCLSIYFQHFEAANTYANDLRDLAHYYREYRRLMQHWRAALPAGVLLEVPYEGLVEDLEGWARKMLEFIGLPWDARCLEFHATKRIVVTASKWQVRQKLDASSIARWRHYERHLGPLRDLR